MAASRSGVKFVGGLPQALPCSPAGGGLPGQGHRREKLPQPRLPRSLHRRDRQSFAAGMI